MPTSVEQLLGVPICGKLRALPLNIRPGLKGLPKTQLTPVEHLSGAPLYGKLQALPLNIKLGRNDLPRTNTLA